MMHQRSIAHAADWDIFLQTFSNVINECLRTTALSILTWHTSKKSFQLVANPCQRNASKALTVMRGRRKAASGNNGPASKKRSNLRQSNKLYRIESSRKCCICSIHSSEVEGALLGFTIRCHSQEMHRTEEEDVHGQSTLRKRRVGAFGLIPQKELLANELSPPPNARPSTSFAPPGTWNNERSAQHQSFRPTYSRRLSFLDPNLVPPPLFPSNGMNQPPCKPPRIQNNASYQREVYQKPQRMRPPPTRNPNMAAPPRLPQQMTTPPPHYHRKWKLSR
ncbi:unnamed protein product [Caenorhabditis brenneri]